MMPMAVPIDEKLLERKDFATSIDRCRSHTTGAAIELLSDVSCLSFEGFKCSSSVPESDAFFPPEHNSSALSMETGVSY